MQIKLILNDYYVMVKLYQLKIVIDNLLLLQIINLINLYLLIR